MFDDYALDVLRDYKEKKDGGALFTNLSHPTPAKLKRECLLVFDKRYLKKDERALSSFFDQREDGPAYRLAIKKMAADKFRPLNIVLRKGAGKTDEKNIELLAWLTDFQPRPYAVWSKNQAGLVEDRTPEEVTIPGTDIKAENPEEPEAPQIDLGKSNPETSSRHMRKSFLIAAIAMLVCLVVFFILRMIPGGDQQCMYWDNDHYESIACGQKPADSSLAVLALDRKKQTHFKRITRADTLTAASIGSVWYVKVNGTLEYYTAGGEHPLYPEKRLLPLTAHILDAYPRKAD